MPNYGLVVTPTYNPMSYEQYVQPFKDYAQVYNATANQIDELEMAANQWEKLADSTIDQPQYQKYKSYADDLRAYAEELSTKGLSGRTRAGLSNMRKRYASDIKPIEDAFNYRQKIAEEQRKLNPNGDMQWTLDFSSDVSLGDIMRNPSLGYSGRNLSDMEREGFEQAKALSSRIYSKPVRAMADQYFKFRQGVSAQEADAWLARQAEFNPETASEVMDLIDNIYSQVRKTYNTDGTDSRYTTDQNILADKRIASGILKGLTYNEEYQVNHGYNPRGSGYGSGAGDNSFVEPVGYEQTIGDKTYTVTNESGRLQYYDEEGNKVTLSDEEIELLKEDTTGKKYPIVVRYTARGKGNLATIYDERSGMAVYQDGKHLKYNKNTQTWNAAKRRIDPLNANRQSPFPKGKNILQLKFNKTGEASPIKEYVTDTKRGENYVDAGYRNIVPNTNTVISADEVREVLQLDEKDLKTILNGSSKNEDTERIRLIVNICKYLGEDFINNLGNNFVIQTGTSEKDSNNQLVHVYLTEGVTDSSLNYPFNVDINNEEDFENYINQ